MNMKVSFKEAEKAFVPDFGESNQTFNADYGETQTIHGKDGEDGKSAYEIALDNGFEGSEVEWLDSLRGEDGRDGQNGKDGYTPIKGVDYFDGEDGKDAEESIFIATQNVSTWDEVKQAINDGKFVVAKSGTNYYVLSNYDSSLIRFSRAYQSTTSHITLNTSGKWAAGSTTHAKSNHTHADIEERIAALETAIANM